MKKLLSILFLIIAFTGLAFAQELPQVPDQAIETLQFPFNGQWMPSVDPLQIGPENYRTLTNLRYNAAGSLESVGGYSKINTTALAASADVDAGFHFKKDNPAETHVLINADGVIYQNTTAIPSQGDFSATALHTDAAGASAPRFSQAPYGHVAYTNGVETMIWAGNEMPTAAFITSTAAVTQNPTNPKDYTIAVNNDLTSGDNVAVIGGGNDTHTKLLMHIDEADAGTAFDDSSASAHNPAAGNQAQADIDQVKFGISSGLFDGASDYITIADHADWDFSTNPFTIDVWVRFNAITAQQCLYSHIASGSSYIAFIQDHNLQKLYLIVYSGTRIIYETVTWAPIADTWYHVALIRGWGGGANSWAITVNGTAIHTFTSAETIPDVAAAINIGYTATEKSPDTGNTGHVITFNNGSTVSAATYKYGNGSAYFDGTTDYLSIPDHADWDIPANWTIEMWVKHTDHVGTETYIAQAEGDNDRWMLRHIHGSGISFEITTGGAAVVSMAGGEINDTNWHHIAVIKVGSEWGIYKDGSQVAFTSDASMDTFSAGLWIGDKNGTTQAFDGYIDEIRIYNGNPYSQTPEVGMNTITTPTGPYLYDSNTRLLLRLDSGSMYGWLDEYRVSKGTARWTTTFAIPVRAYSSSARTWLIGSPRQLKGVKYYVSQPNTIASTLTAKEWQGYSWTSLTITDNTDTGASLAQTGTVTWTNTGQARLKFIENRLMYWYQFSIDAGEAEIYRVTLDAPWQNLVDIWDGVYRQAIQFQAYKAAKYEDYTYDVNDESADTYYADLGGLTAAEHVILMFDDRTTALNWTMVAGKENTTAATVTIYYWDGGNWVTVGSVTDTTLDSASSTKSLGQSGHMSWNPPDNEVEFYKTSFGTTGYAYKLVWSATLTASNAQVNTIYGVPAQKTILPVKFPAMYKDRLFLCGYTEGGEGNRCDYSTAYTAQVFNGADSSDGGVQSLYFGGSSDLTAATQLYNRMGSNIFIFFLALKENETYVLTGDGPETYQIYPVSTNIGCPAPKSLVVAEVGFDIANDVQRHVALWVSYAGPVIFDGAVIYQVPGLETYFDPNSTNYLGQTAIRDSFAWFDQTNREYNVITGTFWVTYNLRLKKWFKKDVGSAEYPISAWPVRDTYGNEYIYSGLDNGYMMRLENSTSWDGVGIGQQIQTGDFLPTKNIWDITRIRRVKLITKRISDANAISVIHYADGDESAGSGWSWEDTTSLEWQNSSAWVWDTGNSVMLIDVSGGSTGNRGRLIKETKPVNLIGWSHGLRFEMTSTDTEKGFQPLMWGIEYLQERRDR